ncbi:BrnA antitoxin family protein [uncultured Amaricoccus sp.]|uniref:BrnA antitoxin family protein n=1 Tax=uncultured Amaricoccus sp. TaxID=339341 RepID=UPI0026090E8A|nr:BrnA antitoxin family protein [uncultured Amaricoccus sp.]
MNGNRSSSAPASDDPKDVFEDDAPDLSTPYWQERFARAEVKRGRPKAAVTKVSTTIRLDPDVLEKFRATGPGWQSRINDILKKARV